MNNLDSKLIDDLTQEFNELEKEYDNVQGWEWVNALAQQQLNIKYDIQEILLKNNITLQ